MKTRISAGSVRESQPWILAAAVLGSTMAFLDGSVVNVALPVIERSFHAPLSRIQWVVESYLLFLSSLLLLGGSLGDRFGRRRVFVAGTALFGLASAACGAAPTLGWLIAARAVQGVGGALLVPGSLALITASFPPGERGAAIGTWSGATALTTALGPLAGGFLVDAVSWRAVFYLNLPLAAAVIAIALMRVPESRDPSPRPLDPAGAALAIAALAGIVLGLTEASRLGFASVGTTAPLAGGVLLGVLFLAQEARSRHPLLPLALFRSRDFSATNAVTLFLYGGLGAAFFFLPFELIQARGYSPTLAGAAMLPFIAVMSALSRFTGRLGDRLGPRLPLTAGPLASAAGLALFFVLPASGSYWKTVFPPILVVGLGMSLAVPPLTTTVMSSEKEKFAGIVSAFNNSISRLGGLLAIAGLSIVVSTASPAFSKPGSASFRTAMGGSAALALTAAAIAALSLRPGKKA
ncbi:MAG: MFS transporter [Thermoanaerobaculia bacterium]